MTRATSTDFSDHYLLKDEPIKGFKTRNNFCPIEITDSSDKIYWPKSWRFILLIKE